MTGPAGSASSTARRVRVVPRFGEHRHVEARLERAPRGWRRRGDARRTRHRRRAAAARGCRPPSGALRERREVARGRSSRSTHAGHAEHARLAGGEVEQPLGFLDLRAGLHQDHAVDAARVEVRRRRRRAGSRADTPRGRRSAGCRSRRPAARSAGGRRCAWRGSALRRPGMRRWATPAADCRRAMSAAASSVGPQRRRGSDGASPRGSPRARPRCAAPISTVPMAGFADHELERRGGQRDAVPRADRRDIARTFERSRRARAHSRTCGAGCGQAARTPELNTPPAMTAMPRCRARSMSDAARCDRAAYSGRRAGRRRTARGRCSRLDRVGQVRADADGADAAFDAQPHRARRALRGSASR